MARRGPHETPRTGIRGQAPWSSGAGASREAQERTLTAQRQVYPGVASHHHDSLEVVSVWKRKSFSFIIEAYFFL